MHGPRWSRWVLAHLVGGGLGVILGAALGVVTLSAGVGAGIGLGIGLAQWLVLKRTAIGASAKDWRLPAAGWVGASAAGALLPGWLLVFAVILGASNGGLPPGEPGTYIGAVMGVGALFAGVPGAACAIVPGAAQWAILRLIWPGMPARYGAGWLAATVTGWGLSWALEGAGLGLVATSWSAGGAATPLLIALGLLLVAGCWAVTGALTGAVLGRLKRWVATVPPVPPAAPSADEADIEAQWREGRPVSVD